MVTAFHKCELKININNWQLNYSGLNGDLIINVYLINWYLCKETESADVIGELFSMKLLAINWKKRYFFLYLNDTIWHFVQSCKKLK